MPIATLWALLLLAVAAHAEWTPASVRNAEGFEVERVHFVHRGNKLILNRTLRAAMRVQEGKPFRRRLFNEDLVALINLYRSRGYRQASIARKRFEVEPNRQRVRIYIEIDNGPLWTVRSVRVRGDAPFAEDELLATVPLKTGAALDYGKVLEGERAIQAYLNHRGYPHARVRNEWSDEDSRSHSASVSFHVESGSKMYFGDLRIEGEESLHTRPALVHRYIDFKRGDLYDPEKLAHSRNELARTNLFRSVFLSTPRPDLGDSVQTVVVQLQERKYIQLGSNLFINSAGRRIKPRLTGGVQHGNWLGRGIGLGLNASWGQPLQGVSFSFTQPNLVDSGADLVLSAGLTDEWSRKIVFGNPGDPRQFDLLTTYDSVLNGLLLFGGTLAAEEYINTVTYDYQSLERLWQVRGALSRTWRVYQGQFAVSWLHSRNKPDGGAPIAYAPSVDGAAEQESDDDLFGEDDFFGGDDFFGEDDLFETDAEDATEAPIDYFAGNIPVNALWADILTERSRSVSFTSELLRDTRDNRIAPSSGSLLRLSGLYAIQLDRRGTSVLDGEVEARRYARLSEHVVAAVALQGTRTASLRSGRALPQLYWKLYGGEGSLRGVDRDAIQAVGGGRIGLNVRSELRFQLGPFGLVTFWDRARVWRRSSALRLADLFKPAGMVDGYGAGLRYTFGFPLRFDIAFNDGFDRAHPMKFYFSIGQAF